MTVHLCVKAWAAVQTDELTPWGHVAGSGRTQGCSCLTGSSRGLCTASVKVGQAAWLRWGTRGSPTPVRVRRAPAVEGDGLPGLQLLTLPRRPSHCPEATQQRGSSDSAPRRDLPVHTGSCGTRKRLRTICRPPNVGSPGLPLSTAALRPTHQAAATRALWWRDGVSQLGQQARPRVLVEAVRLVPQATARDQTRCRLPGVHFAECNMLHRGAGSLLSRTGCCPCAFMG